MFMLSLGKRPPWYKDGNVLANLLAGITLPITKAVRDYFNARPSGWDYRMVFRTVPVVRAVDKNNYQIDLTEPLSGKTVGTLCKLDVSHLEDGEKQSVAALMTMAIKTAFKALAAMSRMELNVITDNVVMARSGAVPTIDSGWQPWYRLPGRKGNGSYKPPVPTPGVTVIQVVPSGAAAW